MSTFPEQRTTKSVVSAGSSMRRTRFLKGPKDRYSVFGSDQVTPLDTIVEDFHVAVVASVTDELKVTTV